MEWTVRNLTLPTHVMFKDNNHEGICIYMWRAINIAELQEKLVNYIGDLQEKMVNPTHSFNTNKHAGSSDPDR